MLPTESNNTKRLRMPWTAEEDELLLLLAKQHSQSCEECGQIFTPSGDAYVMQKEMAERCRNNKPIRTYTSQGLRRRLQILEIKHINDTGSGYGFAAFTNNKPEGNFIKAEAGISKQSSESNRQKWTEEEDRSLMTNYMRVGLRCDKCGQRFTWYSAAYSMRKEMAKLHRGKRSARMYTPSMLCRRWRRLEGMSDVPEEVAWQICKSLEDNPETSDQIVEDEDIKEILEQIIKHEDITET
ncbi:hypothetical protein HYFRA_00003612 [Hymenoscyphus fraxineus]|uniref:C2H2-type domain-containing protein n=1 Tax=Hymenoscyphus fraxineus TaxID=746836 RepID=A0A9N9L3A9_9HELO|nr:hypothetical protein HYFRA_00003612 [Hymenoscyphus fraxineus]